MVKIILHRGQWRGKDYSIANNPAHIKSIIKDYDCEIDLRYKNGQLYLGHDRPDYKIDLDFLVSNRSKLWIHAKTIKTLEFLCNTCYSLNYFFHQSDDCTRTSLGYIWCMPGQKYIPKNGIRLDFSRNPDYTGNVYGVCVDFLPKDYGN